MNPADIIKLEEHVKAECDPALLEWVHSFAPGMYAREMHAPKGALITGAMHRDEHFALLLEGVMLIPGGEIVEAPYFEVAPPGRKRAAVALTDIRFITFHATDKTTVEECEEELFTNDISELPALENKELVGRVEYQEDYGLEQRDREDYQLTKEPPELLEFFHQLPVVDMEIDGVEIRPSKRHGLGLFTTKPYKNGELIAPAVLEGNLICFSRYCNHGAEPNAEPVRMDDDIFIQAQRDVKPGEEVLMDYRVTLSGDY